MDRHRYTLAWLSRLVGITRPQIALQAAAYTALGAYLGHGLPIRQEGYVAVGALVVGLVVAFGFVINDYADFELDRLSKPYRPLPAGEIAPQTALRLATGLALAAIVVALILPPSLFFITCGNIALTAAYSLWLKRTVLLGNIAIGLLNSSVLVFGALAAGRVSSAVWAVVAMSFLYSLAQEVLYTVDDIVGDAAAGLHTTAVYFGAARALALCQGLMLMAMVAALAPCWLTAVSPWYVPVLFACTLGPVFLYIFPLLQLGSAKHVHQACAAVKMVRMTSLLPLLFLPAVG